MTVGQERVFADITRNFKKGGEFRIAAGKMYRGLLRRPTTKPKQYKAIRAAWEKLSAKETIAANKTATRLQNEKAASRDLKMSKAKLAKQKAEAVGKTAAARRQAANKKAIEQSNSKPKAGRGSAGGPITGIRRLNPKGISLLDKLS